MKYSLVGAAIFASSVLAAALPGSLHRREANPNFGENNAVDIPGE